MTSREFSESLAFERLEPDPAQRTVELLGWLCLRVFNALRGEQERPYSIEDFLPDPYSRPRAEREADFAKVMAQFERNRQERVN